MIYGKTGLPEDYVIEEVNPAVEAALGLKRDEIVGKLGSQILKSNRPREMMEAFNRVSNGGEPFSVEREGLKPGRIHRISVSSPVPGKITLLVEDITKEKQRKRTEIEARTAMMVHSQLAKVVHDMNNLLTIIRGCLDLISHRAKSVDPKVIENALDAVDLMTKMVRSLLDFSRPVKVSPSPIVLSKTMNKAIETAKTIQKEKGNKTIMVNMKIDRDLPFVRIDEDKMILVIMNLLTNAFDAMKYGGKVDVNATLEQIVEQRATILRPIPAGEYIRIDVEDNGEGIPQEILTKIFELFESTKGSKGSGIGLAIVQSAIEAMGGYVDVKTRYGVDDSGTIFSIYLPVEREL